MMFYNLIRCLLDREYLKNTYFGNSLKKTIVTVILDRLPIFLIPSIVLTFIAIMLVHI